ncbi:aminotransferase DegT [Psychromonas sp. psych-6C06]|uniref:DegT/DnrJ/EryC1/StrS family aminotransferase n=1 Tax=Psychromonas sp. psych-6C06 TaxID=2058089 RepID=UPI000C34D234|nr:DegT/DnrJ/EryC1/StrS family aminotransferase [Psychromonas sp. psych-6C06]PKF61718.1 aminotransferase DegT [Psychromonas sp. psych-6C06]
MITLNSPLKPNLKRLNHYLEMINDNGWYTNFGPLHDELTVRLEEDLGVKNLLLVSNGAAALQVAGRALGSKSIISTPFSFIATISAFEWQKDTVSFADIDRNSYNLSPSKVNKAFQQGCQADTIVATHVYGNPCDVGAFERVAKANKSKIIYDAAQAFGVKINNKSVLSYGDASILSFHATKIFHTGEGGAIVFKNADNFEKAKEIINFGIKKGMGIQRVGLNAKMSEYHAAVGLVNLDEIDKVLEHRANLFHAYRQGLKDVVEMPVWHPEANYNGAYMPIKLESNEQLLKVSQMLAENDIQSRAYFRPSLDDFFTDNENYGSTNSHQLSGEVLCLPMHYHMLTHDMNFIVEKIKMALK